MQIDVLRVFREIGISRVCLHAMGKQPINCATQRTSWHTHANLPTTSVALEHIDRRNVAWKQYASGPLG